MSTIGPLAGALLMAAGMSGTAGAANAPDAGCGPLNYRAAAQRGAGGMVYFCSPGAYRTQAEAPFLILDDRIPNRIWLRQNPDGSGWSDCFQSASPVAFALSGRDRDPGSILVGPSMNRCP